MIRLGALLLLGQVMLQDEGNAPVYVKKLVCVGGGIDCPAANATGIIFVDGGSGSGGCPAGGNVGEVQFNDGGCPNGVANVETDGTHLRIVGDVTIPAAPNVDNLKLDLLLDGGWLPMPTDISAAWGVPIPAAVEGMMFGHLGNEMNWEFMAVMPKGWNVATYNTINAAAPSSSGTAGSIAWATTSLTTRTRLVTYTTTTSANQPAGARSGGNEQFWWRGNAAGLGGFKVWMRVYQEDTAANTRTAFGLFNQGSAISGATDPDVSPDCIYFGCNLGDSNLGIWSNDNSGTATKYIDLGASFPCTTDGALYDAWFEAPPNASFIRVRIDRLDSAASGSYAVVSDLPRNTVQLNWQAWMSNGSSGIGIDFDFGGVVGIGQP